jgi:hypothetical protein
MIKREETSAYQTHLKGSAFHATNAILLRNAIRQDHTTWSEKLPPSVSETVDDCGVTLTAKPLTQALRIDKRPLHVLQGIIDHPPTKGKSQITVELKKGSCAPI